MSIPTADKELFNDAYLPSLVASGRVREGASISTLRLLLHISSNNANSKNLPELSEF